MWVTSNSLQEVKAGDLSLYHWVLVCSDGTNDCSMEPFSYLHFSCQMPVGQPTSQPPRKIAKTKSKLKKQEMFRQVNIYKMGFSCPRTAMLRCNLTCKVTLVTIWSLSLYPLSSVSALCDITKDWFPKSCFTVHFLKCEAASKKKRLDFSHRRAVHWHARDKYSFQKVHFAWRGALKSWPQTNMSDAAKYYDCFKSLAWQYGAFKSYPVKKFAYYRIKRPSR